MSNVVGSVQFDYFYLNVLVITYNTNSRFTGNHLIAVLALIDATLNNFRCDTKPSKAKEKEFYERQ